MTKALDNLTIFLYKNKLNQTTLIDFLPKFSSITIKHILDDISNTGNTSNKTDIPTISNKLYVFSDGNCKGNGTKNAKGGYSIYFGESELYRIFNKTKEIMNPTNNKAELSGIHNIFKILHRNKDELFFKNKEIIICTDSLYSINCIIKWSDNWIKNNWVNAKKESVKNKELIQEILEFKKTLNEIDISFKHVFGHTKEPLDKKSLEYFFWYGNNTVDTNINKMLTNNKI